MDHTLLGFSPYSQLAHGVPPSLDLMDELNIVRRKQSSDSRDSGSFDMLRAGTAMSVDHTQPSEHAYEVAAGQSKRIRTPWPS